MDRHSSGDPPPLAGISALAVLWFPPEKGEASAHDTDHESGLWRIPI
jgi:hypothetical protein